MINREWIKFYGKETDMNYIQTIFISPSFVKIIQAHGLTKKS